MFKSNFDTIFCPPVNSSGDVYHVAAYLVLCRTMRKKVPQIVLFCDTDDTEMQAQRSRSFLRALEFSNVKVERFELPSAQATVRLAHSAASVKSFSDRAVDQKTTTSLISFAHLVYGNFIHEAFIQHILKRSFSSKAIAAYQWATTQVDVAIKRLKISKQKFVVLNLRYSKNANEGQNLTDQQLKTISKTLAHCNCKLIILDVGGGQGASFVKKHNGNEYAAAMVINAFPTLEQLHKNYEKFPHMLLLLQLSRLPTFLGVIGNTSGTLDIAAFMGLRTLCMHRFKSSSTRNIIVPYQDLRVLLQANIMSVFDCAFGLQALQNMICEWLTSKQHILCHMLSHAENVTLEEKGFKTEHYDRKCFTLDAANRVANPAFRAQYWQLSCDQKLSESMVARISDQLLPMPLTFAFNNTAKAAKDDNDLKPLKRTHRSSSQIM
jgi:hypothetical protein